jgi:xylose isomerase
VVEALHAARVDELAVPTRGAGESIEDLLADRSAYEDFDADKAAERGYGFVALNQLAVEHLLGAR